jgi:pilus assembly protein CpaE
MREVVLCADRDSLAHPNLLGLIGENLSGQDWLKPIAQAEEARRYVRSDGSVEEVWVASSDEMDPINLAAALKRDTRERTVLLVASQTNGSLCSRASSAGIDGVIDAKGLAERYAARKRKRDGGAFARGSSDGAGADAGMRGSTSAAASRGANAVTAAPTVVDATGRPGVSWEEHPTVDGWPSSTRQRGGAAQKAPPDKRAYILSVVSASGGTGKSTVAVLAGLIAQSLGCRTLILDADLQFGDIAQLLSENSPVRIDQALRDRSCLERLTPAGDRPALLAAPIGIEDAEQFAGLLPELIEAVSARFDVIVVNTGAFWTEGHIRLLELSSNTLFLLDQRPACLRATRRALELCARCGVAATPFLFAVNRCSKNGMLTSLDISCGLNGAKVVELRDGGREVSELLGAGLSEELLKARNALCLSLQAFLVDILPKGLLSANAKEQQAAPSRRIVPFRRKRRA